VGFDFDNLRLHVDDSIPGAKAAVRQFVFTCLAVYGGSGLRHIIVKRQEEEPVRGKCIPLKDNGAIWVEVCPEKLPAIVRNTNAVERTPVLLCTPIEAVAFVLGHEFGHWLVRMGRVDLEEEDEESYCDSVGVRLLKTFQNTC